MDTNLNTYNTISNILTLDKFEMGEILILLFNCTDPELFIDFFAAIITFLWVAVQILCSMNGDGEDNEQQSSEDTKTADIISAATGGNDGDGDEDKDSQNKSNKRKLEEDNQEDTEEIPEESKNKKQKLDESLSPTPRDTHVDEPALPTSMDIDDSSPRPSLPPTNIDVDNDANEALPHASGDSNADESLSSPSRDSSPDPALSPIPVPQFDTAGEMDRDDLLNLLRIRNESRAEGDSWEPSPEDAHFILMQIELANDDHSDIGFDENTPIEELLERRITDVAWRINNPEIGETSPREHSEAESSDIPSPENQSNPNPELSDSPTDSEPERRWPGRGGYPTFSRYRGYPRYPRDNNSDDSED
jgi:hypothetical protein